MRMRPADPVSQQSEKLACRFRLSHPLCHRVAVTNYTGRPVCVLEAYRNLSVRCWLNCSQNPGAEADRLPLVGPESQVEERAGRNTLSLIVLMSSDRLFLDRVGRHQSPSPLHRHEQLNTHSLMTRVKGDISTLHRLGTFLLCVDTEAERS